MKQHLSRAPLLALALLSLACASEVTDTEGTTYTFECKTGDCSLTAKPNEGAKKGDEGEKPERSFVTQTEGRVLLVCPAEKAGFDCRPIACEPSTPCSRLGGASFTCEKNICQSPDRALTPADKLALCLAKTGPWQRTPQQLERLTMSRACTGDCKLPAACLGI